MIYEYSTYDGFDIMEINNFSGSARKIPTSVIQQASIGFSF